MRKIFVISFLFVALSIVNVNNVRADKLVNQALEINAENFQGEYLRKYLKQGNVDINGDGCLTNGEIESVTSIYISGDQSNIIELDLKGIEFFYNLKEVRLNYCNITNKDSLNNLKIKELEICNSSVENLDFDKFEVLEYLYVANVNVNGNKINLSKCKNLKELSLYDTELKKIGLNNCKKIERVTIENCDMKELKLGKKEKLYYLWLSNNKLKKVNYKYLPNLKTLIVNNNKLTQINTSRYVKLVDLNCSENKIKTLNLRKNLKLRNLIAADTNLKELNLSMNTKLESLYIQNTKIEKVDLSRNKNLQLILLYNTKIDKLDISTNKMDGTAEVVCDDRVVIAEPKDGINRMNYKKWKKQD